MPLWYCFLTSLFAEGIAIAASRPLITGGVAVGLGSLVLKSMVLYLFVNDRNHVPSFSSVKFAYILKGHIMRFM